MKRYDEGIAGQGCPDQTKPSVTKAKRYVGGGGHFSDIRGLFHGQWLGVTRASENPPVPLRCYKRFRGAVELLRDVNPQRNVVGYNAARNQIA